MSEGGRKFWDFNIGHVLTLIGLGAGLMTIYIQRERDMAMLQFASASQETQIKALTLRIEAQERMNSKVTEMATNIEWIKMILSRQPGVQGLRQP